MRTRPNPIQRTLHHLRDVLQVCGGALAGALMCGMGIIAISLWFWREAVRVADGIGATHPIQAVYSVRLAAVAGIAAAQVLLLHFVVGRIYRPTVFDDLLKGAAGLICAVSLAAAIALLFLAK